MTETGQLISVIIPIYNAEETIVRCLEGVLGQTHRQLEVLCMDDGSTDGTPALLAKIAAGDGRVRVITLANAGAGTARNTGLQMATGDWLSFLDADDIFLPDLYEKMLKRIRWADADICVCRSDSYDTETGQYTGLKSSIRDVWLPEQDPFAADDTPDHIFNLFRGWPWDKLYRASFVREAGLRFQEIENFNDISFVYQSLALARRITVVGEVLIHKAIHRQGSISQSGEKKWDCFFQALMHLKEGLMDRGLYEKLARSYVNRALHNTLWNLRVVRGEGMIAMYQALQKGWIDQLGIGGKPAEYFYDVKKYEEIRFIETQSLEAYLMALLDEEKRKRRMDAARYRKQVEKLKREKSFFLRVYRKIRYPKKKMV